jgi:hypothetical protein
MDSVTESVKGIGVTAFLFFFGLLGANQRADGPLACENESKFQI